MDFADSSFSVGGFQDTSLKSQPKRIIICCDGTWQSSVSNITNVPSNVTRLARYLTKMGRDDYGKEWEQLVFYDAGIGTGVSILEAKREGGTGSGFVGNVIEAYNFIVLNYNLGDQIFCLGFSRGAYTARAVAGLVTDIGVIQPRDMQDFPELYRLYQAHEDSHMFRKSQAWREWIEGKPLFDPAQKAVPADWKQSPFAWAKRPHVAAPEATRWVEAVGVFDTVGALGIPKVVGWKGAIANPVMEMFAKRLVPVEKAGFHNVGLSPYIKHAYHALALDEHRKPFSPTLWHFLETDSKPKPEVSSADLREKWQKLHKDDQATEGQLEQAWHELVDAEMREELKGHRPTLLQVWFPGVHINVGGGSDELLTTKRDDFEQIAMVTLAWMMEQLRRHLSFELSVSSLMIWDRFQLIRAEITDLLKTESSHWLTKEVTARLATEPKTDPWNDGNKTRSLRIASEILRGWASGPIIDSFEGDMKDAGTLVRTPGNYRERSFGQSRAFRLGETNEQIHPSVAYRIDRLRGKYKPDALIGFKRKPQEDNKGNVTYVWSNGTIDIPEYKIAPELPGKDAAPPVADPKTGFVINDALDQFERSLVVDPQAYAFLGAVDKVYGFDSWAARALDPKTKAPVQPFENMGFQPN